jgi:hypothetical protein
MRIFPSNMPAGVLHGDLKIVETHDFEILELWNFEIGITIQFLNRNYKSQDPQSQNPK